MTEKDKAESFKRLGTQRTREALHAIRKIGQLSDPKNYTFDPDDVMKITAALSDAVDHLQMRFHVATNPPSMDRSKIDGFKL